MPSVSTQPAEEQPLLGTGKRLIREIRARRPDRRTLVYFWREHGLALLAYTLLGILITWPLAPNFTTHLMSDGGDARVSLWSFWHVKQWALLREPLLHTSLVYYPHGLSMLLHAPGPTLGFVSLPFWFLGAEAAYNGALLVGLVLTGYTMYLLARSLCFERAIALFSGTLLMTSAMVLAGLWGHPDKVFLGGLVLTALTLHRALDLRRSPWWAVGTALSLLVALLNSGYQFVFGAVMVGFFVAALGLATPARERGAFLKRALLVAAATLLIAGPFLFAIHQATRDPRILTSAREQASLPGLHPDLLQFILPAGHSALFGAVDAQLSGRNTDIIFGIETAVALPWVGIFLCLFAVLRKAGQARRWFGFTLFCILLALGPSLKVLGQTRFMDSALSLPLPFQTFTALPGLDFMRAPGRFMQIGFIGFAVTASYGLAALVRRFPRYRQGWLVAALALVLLQSWPRAWPQEALPAPPAFYRKLAQDPEVYGVFDIPVKQKGGMGYEWELVVTSLLFQTYQMTHGKGIAAGHIARGYGAYPEPFPFMLRNETDVSSGLLVNGSSYSQYVDAQRQLAGKGYRYVVWHKELFPGSAGQATAQQFVQAAFGGQAPVWEDERSAVYEVTGSAANAPPVTTLALGDNWLSTSTPYRAASPATLALESPHEQRALLRLMPGVLHDPQSPLAPGLGTRGVLTVQVGETFSTSLEVEAHKVAAVPLLLPEGNHPISLTLQAGNFRASDYGGEDAVEWSFELYWLDLQMLVGGAAPVDIWVNGSPQGLESPVTAFYGSGWYTSEGSMRWGGSPSELVVYSDTEREVQVTLLPTLIYAPDAENSLGPQGELLVSANSGAPQRVMLQEGQPTTAHVTLQPGWNMVTLSLEAGAFQPTGGDVRILSFAVSRVEILAR